ncbi:MAG: hypothetical protein WBF08_01330 [Candidatus Bathyarchaeia archaeon]
MQNPPAKELAEHIIKNPEALKIFRDTMNDIVGVKLSPIEQKEKNSSISDALTSYCTHTIIKKEKGMG